MPLEPNDRNSYVLANLSSCFNNKPRGSDILNYTLENLDNPTFVQFYQSKNSRNFNPIASGSKYLRRGNETSEIKMIFSNAKALIDFVANDNTPRALFLIFRTLKRNRV